VVRNSGGFDQRARTGSLARLALGEQFVYEFDFGDSWTYLCSVGAERIDPLQQLGITPPRPLPYWGWGAIPDQYHRNFDGDDGQNEPGPDPELRDLPPLRPGWGPQSADRGFTA
jgi:hypothetical protein